jgi:hypothetical protein
MGSASFRVELDSALRACQIASEACGQAIPKLSSLEDGRAHALSDCLELTDVCAQALGRALVGAASTFLPDELLLCARIARSTAEAVGAESALEACSRSCLDCALWCERVGRRLAARADDRSAA